ncbi:hypothetical protein DL96DRAFT_805649 [Flagelloscypha sp. PMI_526]|nr:hypothetical protein DL96DRAFT_805649 [Flagelloscypha sp. PMI_526]
MSTEIRQKQPRRPRSPPCLYLPADMPPPSTRTPKPLIKLEPKKKKVESDVKSARWGVRSPFHKVPGRPECSDPLPLGATVIAPYALPASFQPNDSQRSRTTSLHTYPPSPSRPLPSPPFLELLGQGALVTKTKTKVRVDSIRTDTASTWSGSNGDTFSYFSIPPSSPPPPFMELSRYEELSPPTRRMLPEEPPAFNTLKFEKGSMAQDGTFGRKVGKCDDKYKWESKTSITTEGGKAMDMEDVVSRLRSLR